MDIASLYHLRLVEAHPKYLACQQKLRAPLSRIFFDAEDSETEDSESVDPDDMTWPQYLKLHPDYYEKEKANKEATMTKVAELTKQFENLKASLPAASHGKIEDLESYEPVRRRFKALLSKMRLLDIRYDQVT
ncbi:hypothetical protein OXX69_013018, partial [Metschnikowia pulcherrima]